MSWISQHYWCDSRKSETTFSISDLGFSQKENSYCLFSLWWSITGMEFDFGVNFTQNSFAGMEFRALFQTLSCGVLPFWNGGSFFQVCPIIDVISDDTFEYVTASDMTWGGFNWKLNFRWYRVPPREMERRNNDRSRPLHTPAMAGKMRKWSFLSCAWGGGRAEKIFLDATFGWISFS